MRQKRSLLVPSSPETWPLALACVAAGTAAVLVLYAGGFTGMVAMWAGSATYRSLFFVPPLVLYFLWLRLPELRALAPQPALPGLLGAVPCAALWLLGETAQVATAQQLAAVGMLEVVFLTVLGWRICRRLLLPLALLWLMVPLGEDVLLPLLIRLTTTLTVAGLRLAGMPTVVDGNLLVAGGVPYNIIRECAGLDFLLGNLLVSLAFANLVYHGFRRRLLYVLASVPVAILANNLRTISVVLISAGGIDLATNHVTYGWFLFTVMMLAQMAIGLRFRDAPAAQATDTPDTLASPSVAGRSRLLAATAGVIVVAGLAPAWAHHALAGDEGPVAVRLCLPPGVEPVPDAAGDDSAWLPRFPAADAQLRGRLAGGAGPVDLFVAYYWRQGPGRELIAWGNRFDDGRRWYFLASGGDTAVVAGTARAVAAERLIGPGGQQRLVWYWYWVGGRFTANPVAAKLLGAWAVLTGGEQRAAVIALSARESGTPGVDHAVLQAALDHGPDFRALMQEAARSDAPGGFCR